MQVRSRVGIGGQDAPKVAVRVYRRQEVRVPCDCVLDADS